MIPTGILPFELTISHLPPDLKIKVLWQVLKVKFEEGASVKPKLCSLAPHHYYKLDCYTTKSIISSRF